MTVLLREAMGDRLRHARTTRRRTLRDISRAAKVSLGYLSEVERGQKEASSELLASICEALDLSVGDLLRNVATDISALETVDAASVDPTSSPEAEPQAETVPASSSDEEFEGSSLVAETAGADRSDLRLSPSLRTTISAPKRQAVLPV